MYVWLNCMFIRTRTRTHEILFEITVQPYTKGLFSCLPICCLYTNHTPTIHKCMYIGLVLVFFGGIFGVFLVFTGMK